MRRKDLPLVCVRCNKKITKNDKTKMVSHVPKWNMKVTVHKECAPSRNKLWKQK